VTVKLPDAIGIGQWLLQIVVIEKLESALQDLASPEQTDGQASTFQLRNKARRIRFRWTTMRRSKLLGT